MASKNSFDKELPCPRAQNVYGNAVVKSGAHAHLGNVSQDVNINGGINVNGNLHLHVQAPLDSLSIAAMVVNIAALCDQFLGLCNDETAKRVVPSEINDFQVLASSLSLLAQNSQTHLGSLPKLGTSPGTEAVILPFHIRCSRAV